MIVAFGAWGCWVRRGTMGAGFSLRLNPPVTFSERYRYRKVWRFGPVAFERLRASRLGTPDDPHDERMRAAEQLCALARRFECAPEELLERLERLVRATEKL